MLLVGCGPMASSSEKETDKRETEVKVEEVKFDSTAEEQEVLDLLEKNNCGELDYEGKEKCFHPRGVFESPNYYIQVKSDPHDYFVYWFSIWEKHSDQNTWIKSVSIDEKVAINLMEELKEKNFVQLVDEPDLR